MKKLKRLREERGLSQVKLAARADLNPATVNQIERGMRDASPGTLRKLADALEVSLYELMEEEAPKVEGPPSPDLPKEGGAGAAGLVAWVEHLNLTLERGKELRGEFRKLTEYMTNTPQEEREPIAAEQRIAWVFSGCLEFSMAVSRAAKAYRKRLAPLLEGDGLSPREEELLRVMRSRLEEIQSIRRRFLDLIQKTHRLSADTQHTEKMLRELGQELGVPESDMVPKDV
jgi:transcriptional regulator with XRE-family HTH domain